MRQAWLLAVLLVQGNPAFATPTMALDPIALPLSLPTPASTPIQLAAGPGGSTSVSAERTGASSTVVSPNTENTTAISNVGQSARIRLRLISATGATNECISCTIQLQQAGTSVSQISVTTGGGASDTGTWVTLTGGGTPWYIIGSATGTALALSNAVVKYRLEIEPPGGGWPRVEYANLTMTFRV